MATQINPPRGMRDFAPKEKAQRERILNVIRGSYKANGFDEIETPVMEEYARLNSGVGGDNEKMSFNILRRKLTADEIRNSETIEDIVDMGLRYDLTVPLARFYASNKSELPPVFRSLQIAPVWRAERPQKGRYRQFVQCDIDIIGEAGILAEAELLTATVYTLDALGIEGWTIRVNDRRILTSMLNGFGFAEDDQPSILIALDKLDKLGRVGVITELRALPLSEEAVSLLISFLIRPYIPFEKRSWDELMIRDLLPINVDEVAVKELITLGQSLNILGEGTLVFDPFLVRGMGYYTGAIFEIAHKDLNYSLGGGGRYDGMIGKFLNVAVPAVGISLGFERIVDLAKDTSVPDPKAVILIYGNDTLMPQLMFIKQQLIAGGARVRLERKTKNVTAVLNRSKDDGFTSFAFVKADIADAEQLVFKPLI